MTTRREAIENKLENQLIGLAENKIYPALQYIIMRRIWVGYLEHDGKSYRGEGKTPTEAINNAKSKIPPLLI